MWSIRICRRWLASHTTSHACLLIGRLGIIAFLLHPSASLAGTFTTFGETFQRATGPPVTVTRTFSVPNPATTYTLRLDNGGSSGQFCRVSSAIVAVNGVRVIGTSDLDQNVATVERSVSLSTTNVLTVDLRSNPGCGVALSIVGTDNTPPVVTASVSPAPNASGWNNTDVRVTFTCTDALSGIARCPDPVTVSSEGAGQVVSGTAVDVAGNQASASVTLNIDKSRPNVTAIVSPSPNAAGWNNADVRVSFTCTDAVSGIARCPDPVTVSTEGAGQVVSGTAVDVAGNQASVSVTLNIDKSRPTISAVVSPLPNTAGWNNTDVRVTFACADGGSGIARCSDPVTVSSEGAGQIVSGTAVDVAGNASTASVTLNIDKSRPGISAVVTPPPNAAGWNNTDVRVSFTCTDGGSKIARCPDPVTATTDGAGQVVSGTAIDVAGNQSTASVTLNIDKAPPMVDVAVSPPPNAAGWNKGSVTVTFVCTDVGSGVARCPDPVTVSAEGAGQVISATAVDVAGNQATPSVTVNIDKTPPVVHIAAPVDGSTILSRRVQVSGTVTEANTLSSLTVQGQAVALSGNAFSTELVLNKGAQTIAVDALDVAGNRGSAIVTFAVVLNRPPTASAGGPYAGDVGQAISFSAAGSSDPDNDPLTFAWDFGDGTTATGATPSHAYTTPGKFTVALTASDGRGGTNTATTTASIEDRTPPVVSLLGPKEALPGSQVTMTAQATDNAAVESVTFEVDGADPLRVTSPPYRRVISVPAVAPVGATIRVTATARDTSGNTAKAEATLTISAVPDTENPVVSLNAPAQAAPGETMRLSANATDNVGVATVVFSVNGVQVGKSTEPPYEATHAIPADASVGSSLNVAARATDFSGNTSEDARTVVIVQAPDTTPPTVTLVAPQRAVAGGTLHLKATATDNVGVASVAFLVDGAPVATLTQAPYETDFQVGPDTPPGATLQVEARATDFAGLVARDTTAVTIVAPPPPGGGVVAGVVYDDTTGLPLEGATAQLVSLDGSAPSVPAPQAISDMRGRFRLSSRPGSARIRIFKPGFTESYRTVMVVDGKRTDPFDARLTPVDTRDNQISSVTGGAASSQAADATLGVPAGALDADQSLRLTVVSAQGLAAPLPLGWSPVVGLDIAPRGVAFRTSATLSLRAPSGITSGMALALARWNPTSTAWIVEGNANASSDGAALVASVPQTGQYVVLLADAAPGAPPTPIVGQSVPAVLANPPPAAVSAFITPSPKILFAQPGARSHVGVLFVPPSRMPSGTRFRLDLVETLDFVTDTHLFPDPTGQDLVTYSFGAGAPLTLISDFNVSPSRTFALAALKGGVIDLAVSMPLDRGMARGTVIGAAGGTAADGDVQLIVRDGATIENLPVVLSSLTKAQFPPAIPAGLTFLAGAQLDLHGGALSAPAGLSLPAPAGLASSAQVLVVQLREVDGVSYLTLVGVGTVRGGTLAIVTDPLGDGTLRFPGALSEGRYAFLRADIPLGFVTGVVTGANGQPMAGSLVMPDTFDIVALADASGRYVVAAPLGDVRVTAVDRVTGDRLTQLAHVTTPGGVSALALAIAPTPPTVVAVNPANGSRNVAFTTPVTVTFSEPLDPASVGAGALSLTKGGVTVSGTLSLSSTGTAVTFRPNALLESAGTYQVTVAATVRDLAGRPMGTPLVSQFTAVNVTPPSPPPAGAVNATIPDANGRTIVSATQGTAVPGGTVQIKNLASGAITALTPNVDGSFGGQVTASRTDKLELTILDADGNKTTVPLPAFKNADGSVVVGAAGGRVEGPGGVVVDVPAGALPEGTVVKVDPIVPFDLSLPTPTSFPFVGGLRLSLGGARSSSALKVSVPAPPGATPTDQILVAKIVQLSRRQAWNVADIARLVDGRYRISSLPGGITEEGTYSFLRSDGTCVSYVNVQYNLEPNAFYLQGALPFVAVAAGEQQASLPAACASQLVVRLVNANTDDVVGTVSVQAPGEPDAIFFSPAVLSVDQVSPVIVTSNVLSGGQLDQIQILFSKPVRTTLPSGSFVLVKDAAGFTVTGQIALEGGGTIAVFRPDTPFRLGETYTASLESVIDTSGHPLNAQPLAFTPYAPQALSDLKDVSTLKQALEKCAGASCSTSAIDAAFIGETLFLANGIRRADEQYDNAAIPTRLIAVDTSDPRNPILIASNPTTTNPRAVATVPAAAFTIPGLGPFSGDLLLVAGGATVPELSGKLEIRDVTRCALRPPDSTCLDFTTLKGFKLLSTPSGVEPPSGVPADSGVPLQIAVLDSRNPDGSNAALNAYVLTVPIGIEVIDVTRSFDPPGDPSPNRAPHGLVRGDFLDVAVVKSRVVATERVEQAGTPTAFRLRVFSPELGGVATIGLPGPAFRVATGANFVYDIDRDGRVGIAEDNDDDPVKSTDELFDLAVVTSGALTDGAGCTPQNIPCGELYVVDLSPLTDLAHAGDPRVVARIPLPGEADSVQLDVEAKRAYVEIRGRGLAIVDLSGLLDPLADQTTTTGLHDVNNDGRDDRVLSLTPKPDILMTRARVDSDRGIALINGATGGVELTCVDATKCGNVLIALRRARLGSFTAAASDPSNGTLFVTPEIWSAASTLCADFTVRLASAGTTLAYTVSETSVVGRPMLDFANGQNTGTVTGSAPTICVTTKSSQLFPLESYATIDFVNQATNAPVKRVTLHLAPQLLIVQDVHLLTQIDRINGQVCEIGVSLPFTLSQPARVTIKVDGTVVAQNIARPAGTSSVPIAPELVSAPGEHQAEVTAVFDSGSTPVTSTATGRIFHDVVLQAALPIGHTMIKGVDIVDGHVTHTAQDVMIPGRGRSLDFTRTYSSAGTSNDGPMGAGWTHSYESRLVRDLCGRFTIIGGEGTGNVFTFDGTAFAPQVGFHSTLVRDPQDSGKFDFFTKARVRYHFERELTIPGEVYTLRFIEEPNGNRLTLDYLVGDGDASTLDAVTDSSGRSLRLTYQAFLSGGRTVKRIVRVTGQNAVTGGNLLGLDIAFEYDDFGNLVKVTRRSPDPSAGLNDERVQLYAYSIDQAFDRHNLRFYTDPSGNTTEYVYYDANDQLPGMGTFRVFAHDVINAIRQPEGVTTTFTYDFATGRRTVSNPRAPAEPIPPTVYTLNSYGATVRIEEPLGKVTTMEWCSDTPHPSCPDAQGDPGRDVLMVKKVDAEGRTELFEYGDGRGNLTKAMVVFGGGKAPVTLSDGTTSVAQVVTTYSHDPLFNKITGKTDAEGNTTVYQIDAPGAPTLCPDPTPGVDTGNMLGSKDAEGNVTCFVYGTNGDLLRLTNPRTFVTSYDYDAYGNRSSITDAAGNTVTNVFDERSRLVETRDTFGHHTRYAYDGLDRRIQEARLDDLGQGGAAQVAVHRYRANGQVETTTDGLGHVTRYTYDAIDRPVSKREEGILQADGSTVALQRSYTYDAQGNITSETDPRGVVRTHTYDALNRRMRTDVHGPFTPDQVLASTTYDLVDNIITQTDARGLVTSFVYDGLYRVVERHLPVPGAVITTAYDRVGSKVRETDANGQPTTYAYDHVYRMKAVQAPNGNRVAFAYDATNNKTREEELTTGLVREYLEYDGLNRLTRQRVSGPGLPTGGYLTSYAFDDANNAAAVTDARGVTTRTTKDGLDRVVQTVVDVGGLDLVTRFTYDANGNLRTVQDPEGGDVDVTHDYDGLGRRIRSTYVNTAGDGGQQVTQEFVYDGNDNVVRYKDKRGVVFTASYDNLNRVLDRRAVESLTNAGAPLPLAAYQYDGPNNAATVTDANGNRTTIYFDGLLRPRIVDDSDPNSPFDPRSAGPVPLGVRAFVYDGVNKRADIDKRGQRTEYDYDPLNREVARREFDASGALQTTMSVEYLDGQGVKRMTDRRGVVTIQEFDALQRLVEVRRAGLDMASAYGAADVRVQRYEYDGNSNRVAAVDGRGNRTEFTYDAADRQTAVTEGVGSTVEATTRFTYDKVNNVVTIKDARRHGGDFDTRYTYDARYRRVGVTNGAGETTTYEYDAHDNVTAMTEPNGPAFTTRYTYDELNTLLAVDESARASGGRNDAGVTRFFYDANRNKIAQQDANGNLVTFAYDGLNRLTSAFEHTAPGCLTAASTRGASPTHNPACGDTTTALQWRYGYDLGGNQALIVDALGQRVEMVFDHLNRLARIDYRNHAATLDFQPVSTAYVYDRNGNILSAVERKTLAGAAIEEVTEQTFDPFDRLRTRRRRDHDDPVGKLMQYTYDVQGNRLTITDPDSRTTQYSYDARNRMQSVTTAAGVTSYEWWENGLLKKVTYPNGTTADRDDPSAYDRADRVLLIQNRAGDGGLISSYRYGYDRNGNRLTQAETRPSLGDELSTYGYDNVNRLAGVTYGSRGTLAYSYAPNGNRIGERGIDPKTGAPVDRRYEYDEVAGKPGVTFGGVNALTRIVDNLDPAGTITYEYDRNLNQVAREKAGLRTEFRFGIRDQLLSTADATGTGVRFDYDYRRLRAKKVNERSGRETRYLYDGPALLAEYDGTAGPGPVFHKYEHGDRVLALTNLTTSGQSATTQFFLTDGLSSTTDLTGQSGEVVQSYRYDAWGHVIAATGSADNPLQYTGHYRDSETGLQYFAARYYDDETGRFVSRDPNPGRHDHPLSLHPYLYAYANPTRYVDLAGYEGEDTAAPAEASFGQRLGIQLLAGLASVPRRVGHMILPFIFGPPDPMQDAVLYSATTGQPATEAAAIEQAAKQGKTGRAVMIGLGFGDVVNRLDELQEHGATPGEQAAFIVGDKSGFNALARAVTGQTEFAQDLGTWDRVVNGVSGTVDLANTTLTAVSLVEAGAGGLRRAGLIEPATVPVESRVTAGVVNKAEVPAGPRTGVRSAAASPLARPAATSVASIPEVTTATPSTAPLAKAAGSQPALTAEALIAEAEQQRATFSGAAARAPAVRELVVFADKDPALRQGARVFARARGAEFVTVDDLVAGRVANPSTVDLVHIVQHGPEWKTFSPRGLAFFLEDAGLAPPKGYQLQSCRALCGDSAATFRMLVNKEVSANQFTLTLGDRPFTKPILRLGPGIVGGELAIPLKPDVGWSTVKVKP